MKDRPQQSSPAPTPGNHRQHLTWKPTARRVLAEAARRTRTNHADYLRELGLLVLEEGYDLDDEDFGELLAYMPTPIALPCKDARAALDRIGGVD